MQIIQAPNYALIIAIFASILAGSYAQSEGKVVRACYPRLQASNTHTNVTSSQVLIDHYQKISVAICMV